jgi:hypothetical protein
MNTKKKYIFILPLTHHLMSKFILNIRVFSVLFVKNAENSKASCSLGARFCEHTRALLFFIVSFSLIFNKIYLQFGRKISVARDIESFKKSLKNYLHEHSFYTVEEFFRHRDG